MRSLILIYLSLGLFILGCATSGVNKGDINIISKKQEVELGNNFATEIEKQYKLVKDPQVVNYIAGIGQKIAKVCDWKELNYHFYVTDEEQINAFAIPGGHVYFNKGLILAADNVSEIAGVMAHEISHVVARHSTEQMTRQYGVSFVLSLVLGENPDQISAMVGNLFGAAGLLHYSRKAESEADQLGVKYAVAAGYDPHGMVQFFEKLLKLHDSEPGALEKLFSTHPPTRERIAAVKKEIARYQLTSNIVKQDKQLTAIKSRLK